MVGAGFYSVFLFVSLSTYANCLTSVHADFPITTPPSFAGDLRRRQEPCPYGACGATCLIQGAFCCNPGGTAADIPRWICDNGACITSIRGTTGVVDCYDPENHVGTTQSCIDNIPTATCASTDRCYTCSTDVPFCHWETYIGTNAPTLSWFSCVSTQKPDSTYLAATLPTIATAIETNTQTLSIPTSTDVNDPSDTSETLGTPAIIGISIGGAIVLVAGIALIGWYILRRRKANNRNIPAGQQPQFTPVAELPAAPPYASSFRLDQPQSPHSMGNTEYAMSYSPQSQISPLPVAEMPGSLSPEELHKRLEYSRNQ